MKALFGMITILAVMVVHAPATTHYVDLNNTNPVPPYAGWGTAATNIQDAVDAATDGDEILATNGVYQTGGRTVNGYTLTNRVVVDKVVTVQSVNGPLVTIIQGYQIPGDITGDSAVRCVYATNGVTLSGFTLTNGATLNGDEDYGINFGGGLYCEDNVAVSNCVITGCAASDSGGGVEGGTLNNCVLTSNQSYNAGGAFATILTNCVLVDNSSTFGGGASSSLLVNCTLATNSSTGWYGLGGGGGAYDSTLVNCTLIANHSANGGGVYGDWWSPPILINCVFYNNSADGNGGGAESCNLNNCTFVGNSAYGGGGADGSTLDNCTLTGNSAVYGGGTESCTVNNCTLAANGASYGGGADGSDLNSCLVISNSVNATGAGAFDSTLNNCTVWGNTASDGTGGIEGSVAYNCIIFANDPWNQYLSSLDYCCTLPLPDNGSGNFTSDPLLVDPANGDFHLQSDSPCINAGNNSYVTTTDDLDGNPRIMGLVVDLGAYEFPIAAAIGADYTNVTAGFTVNFISQLFVGNVSGSILDFGDGTVVSNQLSGAHSWAALGDYAVTLTVFSDDYPAGISATVTVHVAAGISYVSLNSTNPVPPYTSWDTAATNIQDAVDAAYAAGTIWVSNGVYQTGMETVDGSISNRITVTGPLTIQSVNGSDVTTIDGGGAVRCVYLATNALLAGFTFTNGISTGDGGGVFCAAADVVLSNCLFTGNSASGSGGGASGGQFFNCTFISNSAANNGGGAESATLNNCTLTGGSAGGSGGGADQGVLNNCQLLFNTATYGGGANNSTLTGATISGNSAYWAGGGAESSTLNDCVISANFANATAGSSGGGADSSTLTNCLLSSNSVSYYGGGAQACKLDGCTLTGNWAGDCGGAVYSTLNNCTISGNSAYYGGGVGHGTATNCFITGNIAIGGGGGGEECTLVNCLVVSNAAYYFVYGGGGALLSTLVNCTVANNSGTGPCGIAACAVFNSVVQNNFDDSGALANYGDYLGIYEYTFSNSCTMPLPPGLGNFTNDPAFVNWTAGDFHLQSNSPCINSGNNAYVTSATDLDGNPRIVSGTVDIGAYEFQSPSSVLSYAWAQQYGLPTDGTGGLYRPRWRRHEQLAGVDYRHGSHRSIVGSKNAGSCFNQ